MGTQADDDGVRELTPLAVWRGRVDEYHPDKVRDFRAVPVSSDDIQSNDLAAETPEPVTAAPSPAPKTHKGQATGTPPD